MKTGSMLLLDSAGFLTGEGGYFIYVMEEHREINCGMNFETYPMDHQVCYFKIASGMHDQEELVKLVH